MRKTCCVTGHRDLPAGTEAKPRSELRREVLVAIEDGYTHFISGFAPGTDLVFAEIVVELKDRYPITLEAAIPHPGRMKTPDKTFQRLIGCCDVVKVHSERYFKGCFICRNRYMVDAPPAGDCCLRRTGNGRDGGNDTVCGEERLANLYHRYQIGQIEDNLI